MKQYRRIKHGWIALMLASIPFLSHSQSVTVLPDSYTDPDISSDFSESAPFVTNDLSRKPISLADVILKTTEKSIIQPKRTSSTKSISSISDLDGNYIILYQSLAGETYDGGGSVKIATDADLHNSSGEYMVEIDNFYSPYMGADTCETLVSYVNPDSMTIRIPRQTLGYDELYGYYEIAALDDSYAVVDDYITGTISEDGIITIDSKWSVRITTGDEAGNFWGIYDSGTTIERSNGTMSFYVYNLTNRTSYTRTVNIQATQIDERTIRVKNFFDLGGIVDITLRSDSTAWIASQRVWNNYYSNAVEYTSLFLASDYYPTIPCYKATDANTISWGNWHISYRKLRVTSNPGYESPLTGSITTSFDIEYPPYKELALTGNGNENNPYLVTSVDDWNALSRYMSQSGDDLTGKYVKVTANLDFTGSSISPLGYDYSVYFNGDLGGGGYTFSGYDTVAPARYFAPIAVMTGSEAKLHDFIVAGTVTSELYYTVASTVGRLYGTVENVTHTGSVTSTCSYTAGIVGEAMAGSAISNCINEGTITSEYQHSGGIVGEVGGGTVTGCINRGTVSSSSNLFGGVAGYSPSESVFINCGNEGTVRSTSGASSASCAGVVGCSYPSTYIGCYNTGTVEATSSNSGRLAGIAGYLFSSSNKYVFTNCYNTGDISAKVMVGGIFYYGSTSTAVEMTGCYNTGAITSSYTGDEACAYAGGLGGVYFSNSTYTNCYNTGKITAGDGNHVGGLFGTYMTAPTSSTPVSFSNCYNTGDVSTNLSHAGGLLGEAPYYVYFTDCYNTGDITTGTDYAGGIVGVLGGGFCTMVDCWNAGNITANSTYAGGIMGRNSTTDQLMQCFNSGNITAATQYAGGIAGASAATMTDVYNIGAVTAPDYAAGITALSYTGKTAITRAYTAAAITVSDTATAVGNIIAYNNATITDAYYLEAYSAADSDTIATALTRAQLATLQLPDSLWTAGDDYTYPRITNIADNDYAKAYAAAVIPSDSQTYDSISGSFYIGLPDSVIWTSSSDALTIDGNTVTLTGNIDGEVTMTATCGDVAVATIINCYNYVEADTVVSYYLTGDFNSWNTADSTYLFTESDTTGVYTLVAESTNFTTSTGFKIVTSTSLWLGYADGYNIDYDIFYTFSTTGNDTYLNSAPTADNLYFTLTADDSGYTLRVSQNASDISAARSTSPEIVSETLYNTAGQVVAEPADGQKAIYIVRHVYSDGTVTTAKEVR